MDTSSLFKKYVVEDHSAAFERLLNKIQTIIIAPITIIEIHKGIKNRLTVNLLDQDDVDFLVKEITADYPFFKVIDWNVHLWSKAVEYVYLYDLKGLDSIQLASLAVSGADQFICSDKKLFKVAKNIFRNSVLI